ALPAYTGTTTLTATANAALTVDGVTATVNTVILVKNETTAANNGLYRVQQVGSGAAPWILARNYFLALQLNNVAFMPPSYMSGSVVMIAGGNTQAGTEWVLTTTPPVLIGTTAQTWTPVRTPAPVTTLTTPTTAGSPYTVTHNLNTTNIVVGLWDATTNNQV